MERYLLAAERVTRAALFGLPAMKPTLVRRQPRTRTVQPIQEPPATYDVTGLSLPNAVHTIYRFPADGEYAFRLVTGGIGPQRLRQSSWPSGSTDTQVQSGTLDPDASASFFTHKQDLGGKFVDLRVRVTAGEHWVAGINPAHLRRPAAVVRRPASVD